jgi:hypothetical protein
MLRGQAYTFQNKLRSIKSADDAKNSSRMHMVTNQTNVAFVA